MKEITITFRNDETIAPEVKWCASNGGLSIYARSREEAIGELILQNAEKFGIYIVDEDEN